jgi:leader peptidase (prepilin peptidase) / N-methyltransferase
MEGASGESALGEAVALFVASPAAVAFAALWGALWGSFLNVCIHRIGLHESVVRPASRCPRCGRGVRPIENIPIVSWIFLRGRCAGCRQPISIRYPLVELLSSLLGLGLWLMLRDQPIDAVHVLAQFFFGYAFLAVLIVLAGIDLDHMIIPDPVTYPAIPAFLCAAILLHDVPVRELVIGPFVGYGLVALTAELGYLVARREVMGYGDAKLLALIGAALGWRAAVFAFFAAPFAGLLFLVPLMMLRRQRVHGVEVPYGPFLALAGGVYLFIAPVLRAFWPL